MRVELKDCKTLRGAVEKVERKIHAVEYHEAAEWLRFDGLNVNREAKRAHPGSYPTVDWAEMTT